MKHFLIVVILFFFAAPDAVFSQTLYTTGVTFCASAPTHNPGTTGAKWALDTTTWNLYIRSYGTTWTLIGNNWVQDVSGCSAPAYTPTKFQSRLAINACDPKELYAWDGAAWDKIAPSSGGVTGTGLTNRLAYWTASGAIGYESTLLVDTTNNRLKIGDQVAPVRTLDVTGEARISDLITDTPTRLIGADADGDLNEAGSGLANRFGMWTGVGSVGYETSFRIDSTNNQIVSGGLASTTGPVSTIYPHFMARSGTNTIGITPQFVNGPLIEATNGTVNAYIGLLAGSVMYTGTFSNHDFRIRRNNLDIMNFSSAGVTCNSFSEISFGGSGGLASTSFNLFESGNTRAGAYVGGGATRIFTPGTASGTNGVSFGKMSTSDGTTYTEQARITEINGNLIMGHTTDANARLDINGSGATSSTDAANFANSNDSTIVRIRNDRRVGINTATPDVSFDMGSDTDGFKMQAGTTAQRPSINNTQRVNTDAEALEYRENGVWFRLGSSQAPTIAAGAGAGTGPTIAVAGSDLAGSVTLTTGTTSAAGALFTVTYGDAFDASSNFYVTFSCRDVDCTGLQLYVSAESSTSFTISTNNAPTDAVQYVINYHVGQ